MNVVAVTGASGFIGQQVINQLLDAGYDVIALGRTKNDKIKSLKFVGLDLLTEYNHEWLNNYQPSYLVHLAWYTDHGKFWDSPVNFNWLYATYRLVEKFIYNGGQKIIVSGTCAEYNWNYGYCQENLTPCSPATTYGISKLATFQSIKNLCEVNNISLKWLRVFIPIGIGEGYNRLIPSVTRSLMGHQEYFSVNLNQWRDFLAVEDVASAVTHLLQTNTDYIDFNVCSGVPKSLKDLIHEVALILDVDASGFISFSNCNNVPDFLFGNNSRLISTEWQASCSLSNTLENYIKVLHDMILKQN